MPTHAARPTQRVLRLRVALVLLVTTSGCDAPASVVLDATVDAGTRDASDAGMRTDAPIDGPTSDASTSDVPDAGAGPVVTTVRVRYAGRPGVISLRGSGGPLSWTASTPATLEAGSVWVLTTTEITAPIEFKPLLNDTEWARGPNYHVAPGDTIEVAPHFVPTAGSVTQLLPDFRSAYVTGPRIVWVYLPPGYDENTAARWPVVYVQDGQNLFDAARAFAGVEWEADETMDAAAETGHCGNVTGAACANDGECAVATRCDTFHGAILVAPEASAARIAEYTPTLDSTLGGGRADMYLRALTEELAPIAMGTLRARTEPECTAILGSSLGGLLAAHASVVRADFFGLVGAMSPSTWWDGRVILTEVATLPMASARPLRVYVDSGDSGPSSDGVADTADLAAAYVAAGYVEGDTLHYVVAPGHQHEERYWALRLPGALAFLLGPREEHLAP